jgi:integrase
MGRRRSFGTVRQLPSGRYQARYPGPDGCLRTAPTTFESRGDASRFLSAVETDMQRGFWNDPTTGDSTLRAYAAAWLAERRVKGHPLAPRTVDTYRHSLDMWILPFLGDTALRGITPAVVRRWHAEVAASTGTTATRQAYALLRAIMNTAVADDAIARNPCRIRGAGQARTPERPLIDPADVEKAAAAMPPGLEATVLLALWAHLRIGEVLGLERRDIDLHAGTLTVERQVVEVRDRGPVVTEPKMSSRRVVHLPEPAITALQRHCDTAEPMLPTARLFRRPDGSGLRLMHLEWYWRRARKRAGIDHAHFHDLRHAGLTLSAQVGATLAEVMRRAGHSSAAAAIRYQHAADSRDQEIAARLSKLATPPDTAP